jgi:hypothetical protein
MYEMYYWDKRSCNSIDKMVARHEHNMRIFYSRIMIFMVCTTAAKKIAITALIRKQHLDRDVNRVLHIVNNRGRFA